MKRHLISVLLTGCVLVAPAFAAAAAAPAPAPAPAEDAAVVQAVLAAHARLTEAGNRLDADAFFAGIVESDATRIIQDGKLFRTRAEAVAAVRQGFQAFARLERRMEEPQVAVLAPGVALLTAAGVTEATLPDGRTLSAPFAVSLVYVWSGGQWRVRHGHYSVPNPPR